MRILSSIAQVEPLPLVPPTVIATGGGGSAMRAATSRTRSSPSAIVAGWREEMWASHAPRVLVTWIPDHCPLSRAPRMTCKSRLGHRLALEQGDEARGAVPQLAPVDDHVDRAFFEEELRALESLGQRFAHRRLDDARARESDERAGLG